uniref:Retroviral polymerase SH3-like domain-containing protein n=1 Tax=Tanacetum cinerariifolium TaxID=118510 RepID=A0A6L2JE87_TANCI|nr:hypothetical protein [Tanacetum cinerariifolium]
MNYFESNPCYDSNYSSFDQIEPLQYSVNPSLNIQNEPSDHELFISKLIQQKLQNEYAQSFLAIAITFDLSTVEPEDSLRMGDEHLDTIPETESDEFINDDESFSDEDISKKIYSNPTFDEETNSMKIDSHHFNVESDLIESLLNHDSLIISSSSKIDSLLDEFAGELILLKTIPPGIDETDCKFDGKADEGFLVGYYVSSRAFRIFNSRTRIVQETMHINFLENQPNVVGSRPTWLFDIDTLSQSMNYQPVVTWNEPNSSAGIQEIFDAGKAGEGNVQKYVIFPLWSTGFNDPQNIDVDTTFEVKEPEFEVYVSPSNSAKSKKYDDKTKREAKGKSHVELSTGVRNLSEELKDFSLNSTNGVNAASTPVTAAEPNSTNSMIPLLYRGEYSQWVKRLMNYLKEKMDGEAMINSIKNGDQPLPRVTQVSIARTTSTEQPHLKDKPMWSDQEKRIQKIDRLARSFLIQGLPNDIYSLVDSNKTAKDLWDALARHMLGSEYGEQDKKVAVLYEYETFKANEGEL